MDNQEDMEMGAQPESTSASNLEYMPSHNMLAFGLATELEDLSLPTACDILRHYFFLGARCRSTNKMFSNHTFTPHVCDKLIGIWDKLHIELFEKRSIIAKLGRLLNSYREAIKSQTKYDVQFKKFVDSTKEIFYIGKCKCNLKTVRCSCGKIPDRLHEFMLDQHNERRLTIPEYSPVETEISTVLPTLHSGESSDPTFQPTASDMYDLGFPSGSEIFESTVQTLYSPRYSTPRFAMMCDRFGVSARLASCLASALFADIEFKDERGRTIIMDKRKVSRECEKSRQDILQARHNSESLIAFSFDGRKNDSLTREKFGDRYHTTMQKEPHIVVLREPHSSLLGYVNLEGKGETSKAKIAELIAFFTSKDFSLENVIAVCSDGEVANTGTTGGVLRLIECHLGRPIHWFVCLLHFNELPFRHLYNALEKSVTTGPRSATGPLAQRIEICNTLQVIENFEPIPLEHMPPQMSTEDQNQLSTDVKYLYQIAQAVSNGSCSIYLANIKPGPVGHSRWITRASRLLRVYIATDNPSENSKVLARYIMKVYVPMYFNIKYYNSAVYGSALLGKFIQWTQYLPDNLRNIVNPVIQNNCYFAHSENVLLSMLFDDRKEVRKLALKKIIYFRDECDSTELRDYVKPKVNFDCTDYVHMIDLEDKAVLFEPPFTRSIPYEHLQQYLEDVDDEHPPLPDPLIPCHIQGTERHVQLLASVAKRSIDKNREGIMASISESREKLARMETRKDFEGNL